MIKDGSEYYFTAAEEAWAEDEALAMVYGMAGGAGDPLATDEGMAIFLARKEELLRAVWAEQMSRENEPS